MNYRYKLLLLLKSSFIVRDTKEGKYYHVLNVSDVVKLFEAEKTTIEFNNYEDFDFGTTKEITEDEYLFFLKGGELDENTIV